jgi:hypothetical protein
MNVQTTKVLRISRQQSPTQVMIYQKQLETVEYFSYFDSMITNDARCIWEIKSWFGHILRRNCLLKHVIDEKMEGKICGGKKRKKT